MPTINFYLTEEEYTDWIKLPKDKRKQLVAWALKAYIKKQNDAPGSNPADSQES